MEKQKKSQSSIYNSRTDVEEIIEYEEIEYEEDEEGEFQRTEVEFETKEEEEEDEKVGEEEEEEEEERKIIKQRRCVRREKVRRICFGSGYEVEEELEYEEEEEEEEEGEDKESVSSEISDSSSVLDPISFEWNNQVYEFEELCDPGTLKNAFKRYYEEPDLIDNVGRARYLHLCQALSVTPIVRFFKALVTPVVDLSYRCIDSKNIRAMCAALEINTFVENLILKFNKLEEDDCHYIGIMLYYNETISVLDLTGCRVGPQNVKLLVESLYMNEGLTELNLSKCNIQDEGMKALAKVLIRNNSIKKLDLSYNKLGDEAATALAQTLTANDNLTNLNLCYNNLFDPEAMKPFFRALKDNESLTHLNLAWNAISGREMGKYLKVLLKKNSTIKSLDISDNRLEGVAVTAIKNGLNKSESLEVLRLGKNPISADTLEPLLNAVKNCSTLKVLDLEDLWVKKSFCRTLTRLQQTRDIEVKIGGVYSNYEIHGPDYPKLILKRAKFEAMKPKQAKKRKNFDLFIWSLGDEPIPPDEFMLLVKRFKAQIKKDLFAELMKQFTIKPNLIDVVAMKAKYLSIFPNSKPPLPDLTKVEEPKPKPIEEIGDEILTVIRDFKDEEAKEDEEGVYIWEDTEGEEEFEAVFSLGEELPGNIKDAKSEVEVEIEISAVTEEE